jgi:acetyl-CoA carboxylase beta subunit
VGEVPGLQEIIYNKDLAANLQVCPRSARTTSGSAPTDRLRSLFDAAWEEHDAASPRPIRSASSTRSRTRTGSGR